MPSPLLDDETARHWLWYFALRGSERRQLGLPPAEGRDMLLAEPDWTREPSTLQLDLSLIHI